MGGKICANMKFTSASTLLQETYDTNHKKMFQKKKKKKSAAIFNKHSCNNKITMQRYI